MTEQTCYLCGPRGSVTERKGILGHVDRQPYVCSRCKTEHLEPAK